MRICDLLALSGVPRRLRLLCIGSFGLFVGMGLYVARISEATSYLSDDPKACINCHIMIPQYATWQRSSHARIATCNDCHVPHTSLAAKLYFKGKDGMRHSWLFTLHRERQVIQAIPESRHVIQENCLRCHARVMEDVGTPLHKDYDRMCVECHREVPHGRVHSLSSTPNARVPELDDVLP
jgi:cytochrome c nitrite reductase small subunit